MILESSSPSLWSRAQRASASNGLPATVRAIVALDRAKRTEAQTNELRAYFVDHAGANIDRDIGEVVFERLLKMRLELKKGSTGALAGMISVGEITRGAAHCGALGYWVDERVAGRGIGTAAVALLVDHCFDTVGLHRLEAWVRPSGEDNHHAPLIDKQEGSGHGYFLYEGGSVSDRPYGAANEDQEFVHAEGPLPANTWSHQTGRSRIAQRT